LILSSIYFEGKEESVRKHVKSLDNSYLPTTLIKSLISEPVYGEGYYVEVSRGCKWLCPFCMESHIFNPPRYRSFSVLKEKILEGVSSLSTNRVVLYSLSFFDHPDADRLLQFMMNEKIQYSVPSIRYHTLTDERIELIRNGGQRTLTIAPETGCLETSKIIGKALDYDHLISIASSAFRRGMNIKLYFMIGLPAESNPGAKIAELIKKISSLPNSRNERVRVTVNPFIPKAWTPMQYWPLIDKKMFHKSLREIQKEVRPLGVRIFNYEWKWALIQSLISLGDTKTGKALAKWGIEGGGTNVFLRFLKEEGLDPYYPLNPREPDSYTIWRVVKDVHEALVENYGRRILEYYS